MSTDWLQHSRGHDVVFRGDQDAEAMMALAEADASLEVQVPALRLTADAAATTSIQHAKGSSYGCPVCEAQTHARATQRGISRGV